MSRYASATEVSPDRSRAEIERTISKYGAKSFVYGWEEGRAAVQFVLHWRHVRFVLPLPSQDDQKFTRTPTGQRRTSTAAKTAYEQEVRRSWRALNLVIKAKLEAVETGIVTFDQEFGMHMVLPDGRIVAEHVVPAIEASYCTGVVGSLLAIGGAPS